MEEKTKEYIEVTVEELTKTYKAMLEIAKKNKDIKLHIQGKLIEKAVNSLIKTMKT